MDITMEDHMGNNSIYLTNNRHFYKNPLTNRIEMVEIPDGTYEEVLKATQEFDAKIAKEAEAQEDAKGEI